MRIGCLVFSVSAIALSGCSWLGDSIRSRTNVLNTQVNQNGQFLGQNRFGGGNGAFSQNPCQIFSPNQPVPRGCNPADVTLATNGTSFPQSPDFSGGQYISGGYGTHAAQAGQQAGLYQPKKRLRKPRWRGNLALGLDKSISGDFIDDAVFPVSGLVNYDPLNFVESFSSGSQASGQITSIDYFSVIENVNTPNISFEDVHSAPLTLTGGVEYIATPRTTLFANGGYTYADGERREAVIIDAELQRLTTVENFIPEIGPESVTVIPSGDPAIPDQTVVTPGMPTGNFLPNGAPSVNLSTIPNVNVANFIYDFEELKRVNLEAGVRHYFNPILKGQTQTSITPFVAASGGANYYNDQSLTITQNQLFQEQAFESQLTDTQFFDVAAPPIIVDVYDSQWVPAGAVTAGIEWQMTPKTALAFESGVRFEGARDFSNGESGDSNISIPFTIRGSYNF